MHSTVTRSCPSIVLVELVRDVKSDGAVLSTLLHVRVEKREAEDHLSPRLGFRARLVKLRVGQRIGRERAEQTGSQTLRRFVRHLHAVLQDRYREYRRRVRRQPEPEFWMDDAFAGGGVGGGVGVAAVALAVALALAVLLRVGGRGRLGIHLGQLLHLLLDLDLANLLQLRHERRREVAVLQDDPEPLAHRLLDEPDRGRALALTQTDRLDARVIPRRREREQVRHRVRARGQHEHQRHARGGVLEARAQVKRQRLDVPPTHDVGYVVGDRGDNLIGAERAQDDHPLQRRELLVPRFRERDALRLRRVVQHLPSARIRDDVRDEIPLRAVLYKRTSGWSS
eukprot:30947-Pelagococcus_subviridis.AAC.16